MKNESKEVRRKALSRLFKKKNIGGYEDFNKDLWKKELEGIEYFNRQTILLKAIDDEYKSKVESLTELKVVFLSIYVYCRFLIKSIF